MSKYTITLADGRQITDLEMNGNNYVSKTRIDETIFENNLSKMTVSDGKTEETYKDMVFVQQMEWSDGTYYLAFRTRTPQEILAAAISTNSDSLTDIQVALAEVYEMLL